MTVKVDDKIQTMETQLSIFSENSEPQKQINFDKPRTATGQFATPRESSLSKREKRIDWLEFRAEQDRRKIIALIAEIRMLKTRNE